MLSKINQMMITMKKSKIMLYLSPTPTSDAVQENETANIAFNCTDAAVSVGIVIINVHNVCTVA